MLLTPRSWEMSILFTPSALKPLLAFLVLLLLVPVLAVPLPLQKLRSVGSLLLVGKLAAQQEDVFSLPASAPESSCVYSPPLVVLL